MRINYPFAAVPNQVCRGGHGAINIATLAVLLSHGRTFASGQTMAKEVGCSRASIFTAIRYWIDNGPKYGIHIKAESKMGETTVYEVDIEHMEEPVQLIDTPVQQVDTTRLTNGHKEEPVRKTPKKEYDGFDKFWELYPKKSGKKNAKLEWDKIKPSEELTKKILMALAVYIKSKNIEKNGVDFILDPERWIKRERWNDEIDLTKQNIVAESKKKAYIDGDQAYKKPDGTWMVITHTGAHCEYNGRLEGKLLWK